MQIYLHSQIVPLDISEDKNHRQKPIKRGIAHTHISSFSISVASPFTIREYNTFVLTLYNIVYSLCSKQKIKQPGNLTNTDNYCLPASPISMYTTLSESSVSIPLKRKKISDIPGGPKKVLLFDSV